MTPAPRKVKITDGALRAAGQIERDPSSVESSAEIIDRETGVRELADILESIIAEAGDLIESRSPELVAQARAALRHFSDEAPRQAEWARSLAPGPAENAWAGADVLLMPSSEIHTKAGFLTQTVIHT